MVTIKKNKSICYHTSVTSHLINWKVICYIITYANLKTREFLKSLYIFLTGHCMQSCYFNNRHDVMLLPAVSIAVCIIVFSEC